MKTERNRRPIIGIPPRVFRTTNHGLATIGTREAYTDSITEAGGLPLILPRERELLLQALTLCDGLLLQGGEDIDPKFYKEPPSAKLGELDRIRDEGEFAALNIALERDLPVLAICRGLQVLNVALGGTLYQDIDTERPGTMPFHTPNDGNIGTRWAEETHEIKIQPGSKLESILGTAVLMTNSLHHQAIKSLAPKLIETALSSDGLIEAVEDPERAFCVGVQYHPECMWQSGRRVHLRLFEEFVKTAEIKSTSEKGPK